MVIPAAQRLQSMLWDCANAPSSIILTNEVIDEKIISSQVHRLCSAFSSLSSQELLAPDEIKRAALAIEAIHKCSFFIDFDINRIEAILAGKEQDFIFAAMAAEAELEHLKGKENSVELLSAISINNEC